MNKGWIKLYRQVIDCWVYDSGSKFDYFHAFVDLLLLANHSDKKISVDGKPKVITKGQFLTSKLKLADRWHWNVKTVTKFLDTLESDGMLVQEKTKRWTTLTIVNYSVYQEGMDNSMDMSMDNSLDNSMDNSLDINKNVKNIKNVKNESNTYIVGLEEVQEIIDCLNEKTGKNFSAKSDKTRRLINTRFKEGYTVADFKKVIDIKSQEWGSSNTMKQYLRPETLFGTKFEGYLNQEGSENDERSSGTDEEVYTKEQFAALRACGYGLL